MTYSDLTRVAADRTDGVLTIALDRPEALNAVDRAMHAELAYAFERAALDDEAKVIVLTGRGSAFSAGGDFAFMQQMIDEPRIQEIEGAALAKRLLMAILDCPKPIVARLNGDAIGLGATIALFCDIVVAADTARIGDPHANVGLVAGDGGAVIWPHIVGMLRAKEFLLLGSILDAARAEQLGLFNHVVPADQLDVKVAELTARFVRGPRIALGWTKSAINAPLRQAVASFLDASLAWEAISMRSADHQEAVTAFQERRRPRFTGR